MTHRYRSRRSIRKLARRSRRNFLITLIIIAILAYSTLTWILPNFINGIGFVKNIINPSPKNIIPSADTATLAPPVLSIPYEATNTAQIDIKGFGTPNSEVKLYIDDESKQTVDVLSDGSFIFEKAALNLGTNNVYGKTLNEQGKESLPSKTIKLIFDNENPLLDISEPGDNQIIQGDNKKIKVAGKTDPGSKVFINNNQVIVGKDGNFSIDQPLNDGDNIIFIKAADSATNLTEIQRKITYNP